MSGWTQLEPNVHMLQDSCRVYAVRGPEGTVLVNAGTGIAADRLKEVASGPVTVLLTHHFRDHTDGAIRLARAGAGIRAPYWDQEYFLDPEQHFAERQTWNSYDNRWDRYSPVRPIPVDGWMMDYEKVRIAGLEWEVVPAPGATQGAVCYVTSVNGRRLAFVGELVSRGGKTGRIAPLQYNYNDFTGAVNLWHSSRRVLDARPDRLLPSAGEPSDDPRGDVTALRRNLKALDGINPGFAGSLWDEDEDDVEEVLPHLFRSKYAVAETHFVVSGSGKVLALDYGYNAAAYSSPQKHHLSNRRPLLHGLRGLAKRTGHARVDAVLVTHFHDDHVNGIPLLRRLFGTEVWAGENFADVLERPERYDRPCLWHEPIPVARRLPPGDPVRWEDIPITVDPMSGHTRYSTLVNLVVDGTRVAHTGDQVFFRGPAGMGYGKGSGLFTNHVYKNGLELGCYLATLALLRKHAPELVLTGHTKPYRTDPAWLVTVEAGARAFDDVHRALMPLDDGEPHFGAESQGGKLCPYRVHLPEGGTAELRGWVLNPFPKAARARAALVCPEGWGSEPVELDLGPRERRDIKMTATPPAGFRCRRRPLGLELTVDGRPFGQVAEALATVGLPRW